MKDLENMNLIELECLQIDVERQIKKIKKLIEKLVDKIVKAKHL